jgi:uncharacterized protein Yka (UPF0111/DUF47 family)
MSVRGTATERQTDAIKDTILAKLFQNTEQAFNLTIIQLKFCFSCRFNIHEFCQS